jgi:predicted enzyme related to lactoylglutathione lyase
MANPVVWFEIYVKDMPRARSFYETVLGVKLARLDAPDAGVPMEMWAFPMEENGSGAAGSLVRMEGVPGGGGGTMVYFRCDDCAVEASRVAKAGGKLERTKFPIGPYGFIAIAVDTEGNTIGLHSMR